MSAISRGIAALIILCSLLRGPVQAAQQPGSQKNRGFHFENSLKSSAVNPESMIYPESSLRLQSSGRVRRQNLAKLPLDTLKQAFSNGGSNVDTSSNTLKAQVLRTTTITKPTTRPASPTPVPVVPVTVTVGPTTVAATPAPTAVAPTSAQPALTSPGTPSPGTTSPVVRNGGQAMAAAFASQKPS